MLSTTCTCSVFALNELNNDDEWGWLCDLQIHCLHFFTVNHSKSNKQVCVTVLHSLLRATSPLGGDGVSTVKLTSHVPAAAYRCYCLTQDHTRKLVVIWFALFAVDSLYLSEMVDQLGSVDEVSDILQHCQASIFRAVFFTLYKCDLEQKLMLCLNWSFGCFCVDLLSLPYFLFSTGSVENLSFW